MKLEKEKKQASILAIQSLKIIKYVIGKNTKYINSLKTT